MDGEELREALKHDEARKDAELKKPWKAPVVTSYPLGQLRHTSGGDASEYPPNVKPLRLKKGQIAALIWEDDGGVCREIHLTEGEARPKRLDIAAIIAGQMWSKIRAFDPDAQKREARLALELADVLLREASR